MSMLLINIISEEDISNMNFYGDKLCRPPLPFCHPTVGLWSNGLHVAPGMYLRNVLVYLKIMLLNPSGCLGARYSLSNHMSYQHKAIASSDFVLLGILYHWHFDSV